MASIQEPEVQLAQRLASNEKPIRTKAIKKLRKYINVRSRNATGGFTGDELLKLWKGLFYCLWMQDKPLLQEELSNQISTLIHSFHDIDEQLLYLESFLQTFKREWTGIDRLRMDKFFQLVRFMFRQTFEMLKRKNWESSVVGRFLELLTAQLLQSGSGAPSGLQFHILDLYMTELAAVGSAELTADQNLIFIEPFCKTAAKTKDRSLFGAICNSILSTIIDQAPFAIEDLMEEVKAAEDSDSGQASEEDDKEEQLKEKTTKPKKGTQKQINGNKSNEEEGDDDDDDDGGDEDDDDDELLNLEELDTEVSPDEDIGPVLQFDYATLADKLFELASRSSTPSHNRQRLYKIIKLLRDLNEGIFPQDEYPEEVSTDEDDEMFGSRKRMKRGGGHMEQDDDGAPAAKKRKGKKKEASTLNKQNRESGKDEQEPADLTANDENKKKKKKKRKKKKKAGQGVEEKQEQTEAQSPIKETDGGPECSHTEDLEKEAQTQSSLSSVKVTVAATQEGMPETLLVSEVKKQPTVTVTEEEASQPTPCATDNKDQSENLLKKTTSEEAEEQQIPVGIEPKTFSEADATVSGKKKKKKKKKGLKAKLETDEIVSEAQSPIKETDGGLECPQTEDLEKEAETQSSFSSVKVTVAATPEDPSETLIVSEVKKQPTVTVADAETSQPTPCATNEQSENLSKKTSEVAEEQQTPTEIEPETPSDATVSGKKKKKKGQKAKLQTDETVAESPIINTEAEIVPVSSEESAEKNAQTNTETDATTPGKKKKKRRKAGKSLTVEGESQVNGVTIDLTLEDDGPEKPADSTTPCSKKKNNLKADNAPKVEAQAQSEVEGKHTDAEIPSVGEELLQDATTVALKKKTKQEDATLKASPVADETSTTLLKKKRKKNQKESETTLADEGLGLAETPQAADVEITMTTPAKRKKKKLAAAQVDAKDQLQEFGGVDAEVCSSGKAAKKRKIPVVFEYETDELEAAASINGLAEEETVAKKSKPASDVEEPSTPLRTKKSQKKAKTSASEFLTFQSNATVPTPLFCKAKGSPSTPLSSKKLKKSLTPKSESKKVTFGLKNNKTAEFRKTDRSLLVIPDGSSRVPFDPKQKPKFGVLKSPPTPLSARKTPKANRKTGSNTPKSTPKRRPSAADFF